MALNHREPTWYAECLSRYMNNRKLLSGNRENKQMCKVDAVRLSAPGTVLEPLKVLPCQFQERGEKPRWDSINRALKHHPLLRFCSVKESSFLII